MSALALKLCFNLNKYYLKPLNNNLTIKRTVQRYNNSNRKTQYFKWFIYFEIASLAGAYLVWNRMNHSQDFRLYMSKNYPIILEGKKTIYSIIIQIYSIIFYFILKVIIQLVKQLEILILEIMIINVGKIKN